MLDPNDNDAGNTATEPEDGGAAAGTSSGGPKNVTLPTAAMAKIRRDERAKGRAAGLAEYAKAKGYDSVEAMETAMAQRTAAPVRPERKPETQRSGDGQLAKENARLVKENADLKAQVARLAKDKARAETRSRELKRAMSVQVQEAELLQAATMAGVNDPEHALSLLRRHVNGQDEATLASFDPAEWFKGLKKTRPALFALAAPETQIDAATGTGGVEGSDDAPDAATQRRQATRPAQPPVRPAPNGTKPYDAKTATRAESDAWLASQGLRNPAGP